MTSTSCACLTARDRSLRPLKSYLPRLSPKDRLDSITVFCEVRKQNVWGNGGKGARKVS